VPSALAAVAGSKAVLGSGVAAFWFRADADPPLVPDPLEPVKLTVSTTTAATTTSRKNHLDRHQGGRRDERLGP
jgi:hypothetical protein